MQHPCRCQSWCCLNLTVISLVYLNFKHSIQNLQSGSSMCHHPDWFASMQEVWSYFWTRNITYCVISHMPTGWQQCCSALIFKKPLLYVIYVILSYVCNLCTFNQFPKCQVCSNFTLWQFIPLPLLLESSAHSNDFMLINIDINVSACKKYILILTLKGIYSSWKNSQFIVLGNKGT